MCPPDNSFSLNNAAAREDLPTNYEITQDWSQRNNMYTCTVKMGVKRQHTCSRATNNSNFLTRMNIEFYFVENGFHIVSVLHLNVGEDNPALVWPALRRGLSETLTLRFQFLGYKFKSLIILNKWVYWWIIKFRGDKYSWIVNFVRVRGIIIFFNILYVFHYSLRIFIRGWRGLAKSTKLSLDEF